MTAMTDSYVIQYQIDSLWTDEIEVFGQQYEVRNPIPDSVYCFKVFPVNECGAGLDSATACSDSCRKP
jgi:hypothetical protein